MDAVPHSPARFSDPSMSAPAENLGAQNSTEYSVFSPEFLSQSNQAPQRSVYDASTSDAPANAQGQSSAVSLGVLIFDGKILLTVT